jgi:hypothetical protein
MAPESQGVVGQKSYLTPIIGYAVQRWLYELFCKVHGLAWRGFPASGGQIFFKYAQYIPRSLKLVQCFELL